MMKVEIIGFYIDGEDFCSPPGFVIEENTTAEIMEALRNELCLSEDDHFGMCSGG